MLFLYYVGIAILVLLDQLTKFAVVSCMELNESIPVVEGIFHLTRYHNDGAAWGMLSGQRVFFIIVTLVVVVGVCVYMTVKKPDSWVLNASLTLLIGGAVGNFIDRLVNGYVVDFLDFRLIDFPIFNIADCFVVVGAIMLAIYLIFMEGKAKDDAGNNRNEA